MVYIDILFVPMIESFWLLPCSLLIHIFICKILKIFHAFYHIEMISKCNENLMKSVFVKWLLDEYVDFMYLANEWKIVARVLT